MIAKTTLIGQDLNDSYRIEVVLGQGGMGTVYAGLHLRLRRPVAIKVLSQDALQDDEAVARFEREAMITGSIGHPHIVEVLDFNRTADGTPYIVMELLEGEDLGQRMKDGPPITIGLAAAIIEQTSAALQAAHDRNVVHRDLKPSNIFLCRDRGQPVHVKLLDFGISKVFGSGIELTRSNRPLGTPAYMAPEQATGDRDRISPRTDLFALATIVYRLLAGAPPFRATSVPHLMYEIAHVSAPRLEQLRPDLAPEIAEMVHDGLIKDPDQRPSSIAQYGKTLAEALARQSAEALVEGVRPAGSPRPQPERADETPPTVLLAAADETPRQSASGPRPRRRWRYALVAAAIAVVCGVSAIVWLADHRPSPTAGGTGQPAAALAPASRPAHRVEATSTAPAPPASRPARAASAETAKAPLPVRKLDLTTTPSRARVSLDGRALGLSPLRGVEIPTRAATLLIRRRGRRHKRLALRAGQSDLRLHLTLPRRRHGRGRVKVQIVTTRGGELMWADLYVDGTHRGRTPTTLDLSAGTHRLRLVRSGYRPVSRRLRISTRKRHLSFELKPR